MTEIARRARLASARFIPRQLDYETRNAAILILPVAIVLMAVMVYPIVYSFYISLFSLKLTRPHRVPFVWFDNYLEPYEWDAMWARPIRMVRQLPRNPHG